MLAKFGVQICRISSSHKAHSSQSQMPRIHLHSFTPINQLFISLDLLKLKLFEGTHMAVSAAPYSASSSAVISCCWCKLFMHVTVKYLL